MSESISNAWHIKRYSIDDKYQAVPNIISMDIIINSKEKGKLEQNYKGEPHNEETFVGASLVAQG